MNILIILSMKELNHGASMFYPLEFQETNHAVFHYKVTKVKVILGQPSLSH